MFLVKSFKLNCVLRLADVAETALSLIENPLFYVFLFQYLCVPFRKKVNRSKKKNSITKLCLCPLSLSLSLAIAVRTKIVTKRTLSEQLDNFEPQQRSVFI